MNGALRAPVAHGFPDVATHPASAIGRVPSGTLFVASGAAIGLVAGIALAFTMDAFADTPIREIGPFSAPAEMCGFDTFEISAGSNVPAVARCDHLFDGRQYVSVGYRL